MPEALPPALAAERAAEQAVRRNTTVGLALALVGAVAFSGKAIIVKLAYRHGFDLVFCMTDKASGREVARGKVGVVFVDPVRKRVALLPAAFRQRLEELAPLETLELLPATPVALEAVQ